jgi:uncharacterized protein involved in tolerance to divalent cations
MTYKVVISKSSDATREERVRSQIVTVTDDGRAPTAGPEHSKEDALLARESTRKEMALATQAATEAQKSKKLAGKYLQRVVKSHCNIKHVLQSKFLKAAGASEAKETALRVKTKLADLEKRLHNVMTACGSTPELLAEEAIKHECVDAEEIYLRIASFVLAGK